MLCIFSFSWYAVPMSEAKRRERFLDLLFTFGEDNYRTMDWRPKKFSAKHTIDPYHILVSECMLQQTQVDRVREKFAQFIARFPSVHALAVAPLKDVLHLWSGLGYNRRAVHLHACAQRVVGDYDGVFPKDFDLLCELPGIGPSTAAGILSFAWNKPYPMIDTNIRRILKRCFPETEKYTDKTLFRFAQTLIPEGKGRMWNYAMLDVGALACTARRHAEGCPFSPLHGPIEEVVLKKKALPFIKTKRYLRGLIMKILLQKHRTTLSSLKKTFATSPYDLRQVLAEMHSHGLIRVQGQNIILPEK
jgi:A/G-specific adenine glycosylase